jgi:hypothetical protein
MLQRSDIETAISPCDIPTTMWREPVTHVLLARAVVSAPAE